MTDLPWHWLLPLALTGIAALLLALRFPGRRWLLPIAVTAAGAIVSILFGGDSSALFPILLTGVILTVCAAASGRK